MSEEIKNNFPELSTFRMSFEKRDYIERRLIAMADAGTLRVNDILKHPISTIDLVGEVLMGHRTDGGKQTGGHFVPHELQSYKVRIKSLHARQDMPVKPICYKHGLRPVKTISRRVGSDRADVLVQESHFVYPCGPDATEGVVNLPEAFRVLSQSGKHNTKSGSPRIQAMHHYHNELESEAAPQPKKRRPVDDRIASR